MVVGEKKKSADCEKKRNLLEQSIQNNSASKNRHVQLAE